MLFELLKDNGHCAFSAGSAERAWELFNQHSPDLVLTDIEMPDGRPAGLELLQQIKRICPTCPVIVLTGHATKERAVQALRAGAHDFIEKPLSVDELTKRVENALTQQKVEWALSENADLKRQLHDKLRFDNIIGTSPAMEKVYRIIERVAGTTAAVLIRGESGTGKELVARALHHHSPRAAKPFVAINCAALPEHLLESELFGHRKGSFTGAAFDKVGLLEAAQNGTVFLDEIGSMPLGLQGKLLRFLQEKELRRVGDTANIHVDARVLAATNEPLEKKIAEKTYREDLYYRLSVIQIELPPLRERTVDIPHLATKFIHDICTRQGLPAVRLADAALAALPAYPWPGNVRELQNALERACVLCDNGVIEVADLPVQNMATGEPPTPALNETTPLPLKEFTHQQEVAYVRQVLRTVQNNRTEAARLLQVSPSTLYRLLGRHDTGIDDLKTSATPVADHGN
ncbi:MAG: Regulatory protein AtoC [Verrucomicrobiae bacterium]|nr:Regulatory protein AtoC [Verrucomicrobiae bacterium]